VSLSHLLSTSYIERLLIRDRSRKGIYSTILVNEEVADNYHLPILFFQQYTYLPVDHGRQKLCLSRLRNMDYHRRLYKKAVVCQRDHLINIAKTQRNHVDASLQPLTITTTETTVCRQRGETSSQTLCFSAVAGTTFRVMDAGFAIVNKIFV
jgi:hypothetical protein